jgi:hypothetical protein
MRAIHAAVLTVILAGCGSRSSPPAPARPIDHQGPGDSSTGIDDTTFLTPEDFEKLPVGINVVHEPSAPLATLTGKSERRSKYTWWYKTTVSAVDEDVTIVQFGGFTWEGGRWAAGRSFTGKPYAAAEFAEWYKCPDAVLKRGKAYADTANWSTGPELRARKERWYFIGVDRKGRRVKGEAVLDLNGDIDPKRPKDAD